MFTTLFIIFVFVVVPVSCGLYLDSSLSNQGMLNVTAVPIVEQHVTDYANVLSNGDKVYLENLCKDLKSKTSTELAVVIVKNMSDNGIDNNKFIYPDIESYAHEMFNKNGFGKKDKNNGILFLTSVGQRKTRIEVGYGLEGILNDGKCGRILDTYAIPYFKKNQFDVGVIETTKELVSILSPTSDKKKLLDEEAEAKRQELNLTNIKDIKPEKKIDKEKESIEEEPEYMQKLNNSIGEIGINAIFILGLIVAIFTSFLILLGLFVFGFLLYFALSFFGVFAIYPLLEIVLIALLCFVGFALIVRVCIAVGIFFNFGSGGGSSGGGFGGFGGGSSGGGGASRGF